MAGDQLGCESYILFVLGGHWAICKKKKAMGMIQLTEFDILAGSWPGSLRGRKMMGILPGKFHIIPQ